MVGCAFDCSQCFLLACIVVCDLRTHECGVSANYHRIYVCTVCTCGANTVELIKCVSQYIYSCWLIFSNCCTISNNLTFVHISPSHTGCDLLWLYSRQLLRHPPLHPHNACEYGHGQVLAAR